MSKRELIIGTVKDLAAKFIYYDRKEDEDLPIGAIEAAVKEGVISYDEIINIFKKEISSE